jgi:hypothetical protein
VFCCAVKNASYELLLLKMLYTVKNVLQRMRERERERDARRQIDIKREIKRER